MLQEGISVFTTKDEHLTGKTSKEAQYERLTNSASMQKGSMGKSLHHPFQREKAEVEPTKDQLLKEKEARWPKNKGSLARRQVLRRAWELEVSLHGRGKSDF